MSISKFLNEVFSSFSDHGIKYSVLRNYETLPYSTNGSDIDILIHPRHFNDSIKLLLHTARLNGGNCVSSLRASGVHDMAFCGFIDGKWWGVRFDVFTYVGTNNCAIISVEKFLDRSIINNGVSVAKSNDSSILSFLKEVIGSGHDKKNYSIDAIRSFKDDESFYANELKNSFGEKTYNDIVYPLMIGVKKDLSSCSKLIKKAYRKKLRTEGLIRFLYSDFLSFSFKVKRLIKPPGFSVAILGVDGSGKSTLIDLIKPVIFESLHNRVKCEHLRPNYLPSLASIIKGKECVYNTKNPHKSKPSGLLVSLFRLTYYSIDYIFGYIIKVHFDKSRRVCLWVFDRYFYDYMIDPIRSRISTPVWLIKVFCLFYPQPNIILCLGTDPLVIHQRKPELPLNEVERQVATLKDFCSKKVNAVWIDTGCAIDESVDDALTAITVSMSARYKWE